MHKFTSSSIKFYRRNYKYKSSTVLRNLTSLLLSSCLWNQDIYAMDLPKREEHDSTIKYTHTPLPPKQSPSQNILDECKRFIRGNGSWYLTEQGVILKAQGDVYINRSLFKKNLSIQTDGTVHFENDADFDGDLAIQAKHILMSGNIKTKGFAYFWGDNLTVDKEFSAEKGAQLSIETLMNKGIFSTFGWGLTGTINSFVNAGKIDFSHAKFSAKTFDNKESSVLRTRGHFLLQGDFFKNQGTIFTVGVHQMELKNAYEDRGNLYAPTLFLLSAPRIEYFARHNSWLREGIIAASLYFNIAKNSNFTLSSSEDRCFLQLSSQGDFSYGGAITQRSTAFPFAIYDEIWASPASHSFGRQISSTNNHPLARETFSLAPWNQVRNHWESGVVFHTDGDSIALYGSVDLTAGTVRKSVKGRLVTDGTHLKAGFFTGDDVKIESKNAFLNNSEFSALNGKISALVAEKAHLQNIQIFGDEIALVGTAQLRVNDSKMDSKRDLLLRGGQLEMAGSSAKSQGRAFLEAESQLAVRDSRLATQGNHFSGQDIGVKQVKMSGDSTMDAKHDLAIEDIKASSHLSTRSGNKTSFNGQNQFNGINSQAKHIGIKGQLHDLGATQLVAEKLEQDGDILSESAFIQADDFVDNESSKTKALKTLVLINEKGTGIAGRLEGDTVVIKIDDFQLNALKQVIAKVTQLHINKDVVINEDLLLNNTLHLWANSLIQKGKVKVMGDLVAQLKEEVELYSELDIQGNGAIIAGENFKADYAQISAENLLLQSKTQDVSLYRAAIKALKNIKIQADEGNIKKTSSLFQAGNDVELNAGKNIESRSEVVKEGSENNFHSKKVVNRIEAGGKLSEEAGGHILFASVENKAGGDISYKAGGHIIDQTVALETQYSHGDNTNFDKGTIVRHSVSTHQAGGNLVSSAEGNQELYAPEISASTIKIEGKKQVNIHDVHDTEQRQSQSESDGGFFGQDRKKQESSLSARSQGAKFYGRKRLEIIGGEGVNLTNITSTAPITNLTSIAGAVRTLLGKNQSAFSSNEKSSNVLWNKQSTHVEEHRTFSASSFAGSLEIQSKEAFVESIKGQSLDFMKQLEGQNINVIVDFLEEFHKDERKTIQAPSTALAVVVVVAVTICTAGTGAAIGGAVAGSMAATGTMATVITGMTAAAFTSLCSQAALALLSNEGNIIKAAESLASTKTLENMGIAMITAGITSGVSDVLNIPQSTTQATTLQNIERQAIQSTVGFSTSLISGQKTEEALLQAAKSVTAGIVSCMANRSIGEAYKDHDVDFIGHKFLHALVGGATGAFLSDDPLRGAASGAFGAVTAEMIGELVLMNSHKIATDVVNNLHEREIPLSPENVQAAVMNELKHKTDFVKLLTSGIALLTGQDVSIASFTASSAVDNNLSHMAYQITEMEVFDILERDCAGIYISAKETLLEVADSIFGDKELPEGVIPEDDPLTSLAGGAAATGVMKGAKALIQGGKVGMKVGQAVAQGTEREVSKQTEQAVIHGGEAHSAANRQRLATQLRLEEEGVINQQGRLTQETIEHSRVIQTGSELSENFKSFMSEIGQDPNKWSKVEAPQGAIKLHPSSQEMHPDLRSLEVHFYKNNETGEIITTRDYKAKANPQYGLREGGRAHPKNSHAQQLLNEVKK